VGRALDALSEFWHEALSWFLWPFYLVHDAVASFFGREASLRRRSWRQVFVDGVMLVPVWVGFFFVWLFQSIVRWPQFMRLRDLASGLPALLAAVAAVVVVFGLEKKEEHLVAAYGTKTNELHDQAQTETEEDKRKEILTLAQFYARALLKLKPDDLVNRYRVGFFYQELGEHNRAQSIMDSLAPRNNEGFAMAHLWQADRLLSGPLSPDVLGDAEAHFLWALGTYDRPEEIHRRLGELYYFRYLRYTPQTIDPRMPSRELYLIRADEHLSKVTTSDPSVLLTLAEIRNLRGKREQAEVDVRRVIDLLKFKLDGAPADADSRLRLAQAHRMVREFDKAADVLIAGLNLRPDPRFNEELSVVYYFFSLDVRQRYPKALPEQFAALYKSYLANPVNNYVAHRFVQALTSESAEEADAARKTLQAAVDAKAPGRLAPFLLGFDYQRRTVPQRAAEYFRLVKNAPADAVPAVMAGLATAVLHGQLRSLNPSAVHQLFEASLLVWPDDPDLLMVRAQQNLALRDFPKAASDLKKALERRPRDAKLHEVLAATYQQMGQLELAQQHRDKAESYRGSSAPLDF
jgi:tetratricopeptide (TPR) repeat protein